MKRIAIIGTQGVPASYGGFETLVENIIGENCPSDIQYTVFCSSKDLPDLRTSYKSATLKYIPLHANGMQSIPYDIISMIRSIRGYDIILVLGVSGCIFLPVLKLLSKARIIVNIDGLEHRRAKWGRFAKWFLKQSEALAVKFADAIIADNKGISDYVSQTYHKDAEMIAYGGDHVLRHVSQENQHKILEKYALVSKSFAMCVCRIEPENNCHITLEAFSKCEEPLVFIGNWNKSDYGRELKATYGSSYKNIKLLDPIYDLDVLYTLRSHCSIYIHGHSAGGTNPSLVEAMFFSCPIIAFDVVYNRETTKNKAYYFANIQELLDTIKRKDLQGSEMQKIAKQEYTWENISHQYCSLFNKILN